MMRMKQTTELIALLTEIHVLRWRIYRSRGVPGPEGYIHNELQLVKVGFIHIQEPHSGLDCRSQLCQNINHRPGNTQKRSLQFTHGYLSSVSVSDTLGCGSEECPNINDMPPKPVTSLRICEPISHILTQVLNISSTNLIAKWDGQRYGAGSVRTTRPEFAGALEH